jgi:glutaredoxin
MKPSESHAEGRLLVLYGRPACHLCDVAKEALFPIARAHRVRVEERNVEDRREWEEAYGHQVPVGVIQGRRVFKYRVDEDALRKAFSARWPVL